MSQIFKAGFVNLIGRPNVGKSTLMNALMGEKLSITTPKAQTTRHRIGGILNADDYQIVFSDTPGIIKPAYELQKAMMHFVYEALEDGDIILYITDQPEPNPNKQELLIWEAIGKSTTPVLVILNKIDLIGQEKAISGCKFWNQQLKTEHVIPVSALHQANTGAVLEKILDLLPEHPPFFPVDEISDKNERFFAAEIIREKIFLNYQQEIPYSAEVVIMDFKEEDAIIKIRSEIYVERTTQKGILIGKGGESIKKVGIEARKDLEKFFNKKVFLEQYVRVEPDWRKKLNKLSRFGYRSS